MRTAAIGDRESRVRVDRVDIAMSALSSAIPNTGHQGPGPASGQDPSSDCSDCPIDDHFRDRSLSPVPAGFGCKPMCIYVHVEMIII